LRGRVRGLQTHKRKEQTATPGSRTAVNISGVSLEEIRRGDVIAYPGTYRPTQRIDVFFRLLADALLPLRHNTEAKLFIGATEVLARVRLLGSDELLPGDEGWLQLELSEPVVAVRGDRYILRRPSPGETLGGGSVIDPHPRRRHKRFAEATIESLQALARGTSSDVLLQTLLTLGAAPLRDVVKRSNLEAAAAAQAIAELAKSGQIIDLDQNSSGAAFAPDDLLISAAAWNQFAGRAVQEVGRYHQAYPLRPGIPREELKSRLKDAAKSSPRLFNAALRKLVSDNELVENGPLVKKPEHSIRFSAEQERSIARLLKRFEEAPYNPPSTKECQAEVGEDVVLALIEMDRLVSVAPDVLFRKEDYQRMILEVRQMIEKQGSITVAEARDHFNTSRKYILAFMEHLDAIELTQREGDLRRLKKAR
jgi:selenocysteine-specific elongation factor